MESQKAKSGEVNHGYESQGATNNVDIGVATVTITGINNYAGTYEGSFIIYGDLSDATIAGIPNKTYTGSAINPVPQVTIADKALVAETDFELTYENNEDAGEATVTVTDKGDYYRNSQSATFVIDAAPIGKAKATLAAKTFTGKALSRDRIRKQLVRRCIPANPVHHRRARRAYPQISSPPAGVMDGIDGFAPTVQEPTWSVLACRFLHAGSCSRFLRAPQSYNPWMHRG